MQPHSIVDAIGDTPLVALRTLGPPGRTLLVKMEGLNPGGSSKDRAVRSMIRAAESEGRLKPGATLVEGTAGNTGIGLAWISAALGYRAVVVLPRNASPDKLAVLKALGAELVLTPPDLPLDHPESYVATAKRIERERPGAFRLGQFDNLANPSAHVDGTGPEIWLECEGKVDVLVSGVGTGGTLAGTSRFLREQNPRLRVVVAHPEKEPTAVEGITDDDPPPEFSPSPLDVRIKVPDAEAIETARQLARKEGLLVGLSSGLAVAAALRDAPRWAPDSVAVVIAPDTGRNYLAVLGGP